MEGTIGALIIAYTVLGGGGPYYKYGIMGSITFSLIIKAPIVRISLPGYVQHRILFCLVSWSVESTGATDILIPLAVNLQNLTRALF